MKALNFQDSNAVIEIKLWNQVRYRPEQQRIGSSPGFGHCFEVITGIIRHCLLHKKYPVINDDDWWYGKWTDFFNPFWDEQEKKEKLEKCTRKEIVDLDDIKIEFGYIYFQDDHLYREILEKIYDIKESIKQKMQPAIDLYGDADLAIHMRIKYGKRDHSNLDAYKNAFDQALSHDRLKLETKIFVLADDYQGVEFCRQYFDCQILTVCPKEFDGSVNIRNPEGCYQLLTEIEIARLAKHFVGAEYSAIPRIINYLRHGKNVTIMKMK